MYLEYFQLKEKPFQITTDPKFLWLGEKHKEALATLRYGILDNRGFLLLTGEVGTGKTLLINRLITLLDLDTVVATLPDPDLTSMDFYNLLADGFKMNRTFDSKGVFLIHLRDFLHQSYIDHKQVLLIIDESQRLNHRLMEDIRVLSNIELQDRKLINIFFVGQQEFNTILTAPQNRALAQRITVRYHIAPLNQQEVGHYIKHRLKVAGSTQKIFSASSIGEIFQFSGGIPRLINIICDHALLTGYARNTRTIDAQIIKECTEELRIPLKTGMSPPENNGNYSDSRSIASAAAKQGNTSGGDQAQLKNDGASQVTAHNETGGAGEGKERRSPAWKLLYAAIVILLVALAGFAITQITSEEQPRYDAEELTPQKYKTSLEKEKELLSQRIETGDTAGNDPAKTSVVSSKPSKPEGVATGPAVGKPADSQTSPSAGTARPPMALSAAKDRQNIGEIEPLPLINEKIMIHFTLNSNEIDAASYDILDRTAAYLAKHPNQIVYVRGYTDSSGSTGYNETVSRFRANAVKSYLVGKGASSDKIVIFAMGATDPIGSNDTAEGRRQNRRVVIEFPNGRTASTP